MKKTANWINYEQRLNRVHAYIHDHLDEEIDLNRLADVAHLSAYHWHRVYQAVHGETVAATVKRLRLHRAAGYLANSELSIDEIARRSGYPNLQSFTRIFKSVYGMPPAQYRKQGSNMKFKPSEDEQESVMYDVQIKTAPAVKSVSVEHIGNYMAIDKSFNTLFNWLNARDLYKPEQRWLGVYFGDVNMMPEEKLRSRACLTIDSDIQVEAPVELYEIAGGSYAVLSHKGPYADMEAAYKWLYGQWLVESGRQAGDRPAYEDYLNSPQTTPPAERLTDIYLPLK